VNNPNCHGEDSDFLLELSRPDVIPEFVLANAFVLQGRVMTSGEPLLAATLLIQGRYPSSLPFYETSLLNGDFGNVIPLNGGAFRILVKDKLFAEFMQLIPATIMSSSRHKPPFRATLEREVIQVFAVPFGDRSEAVAMQ